MRRHLVMTTAFAFALLVPAVAGAQTATSDGPPVYGSQLMTEQERQEQRQRMRNATSEEERQQIRAEHHNRMQERARQQGVTLPEQPPGFAKGREEGIAIRDGVVVCGDHRQSASIEGAIASGLRAAEVIVEGSLK